MKVLLIIIAFTSMLLAEYEKAKIDMHGGKNNYSYEKKSSFGGSMGFSSFLDTNSSKKTTPKEKKD